MATRTQPIETVFLKEFVRQLIINSKPVSKVDKEIIARVKMKLGMKTDIPLLKMPVPNPKPQLSRPLPKPVIQQRKPLGRPFGMQQNAFHQMQRPQFKSQPPRHISAPEKEKQPEKELNLGKLRSVFLDSGVVGVECPGPSKNILINRGGRVQPSQITLSPEEITEILQEFSKKTKIPLISGIFKALYNNFLITAIISETAGNRFIIEKHFGQPSLPRKEDVK